MNKTKIEWCDYTWNPVTGCLHGCSYCYAKKTAENPFYHKAFPYGFKPHFYQERLKEPAKKKEPQSIFVCSGADLFGEWVPGAWINTIFTEMAVGYQHTYILLTKNPTKAKHRLIDFFYQFGDKYFPSKIPQNWWIGVSVESSQFTGRIDELLKIPTKNRFVSFEPLLGSTTSKDFPLNLGGINQVIIGAQTNPTIYPDYQWVKEIEDEAHLTDTKIFCKDSTSYVLDDDHFKRELAWPVHK